MPSGAKTGKLGRAEDGFDPAAYAPVAERISLFYDAFPSGRIVTELISRTEQDVVFRALVYRGADDSAPAATGWAAEREGDGDVNEVACLENTETSAIGRALANLGFTASRQRPSAEEMAKASRARLRRVGAERRATETLGQQPDAIRLVGDALQRRADEITDVLVMIRIAERLGFRRRRAGRLRALMLAPDPRPETIRVWSLVLERWIAKRRTEMVNADPAALPRF